MGKKWRKVIYLAQLKVIQPQPKYILYKTIVFQNLIKKRFFRDIYLNQKQTAISK